MSCSQKFSNSLCSINGVVLLDKPHGITSNTALVEMKRLFKAKKAGHTGALDPIATGILPICFGEATKLSHFLLNANKRYLVSAQLGSTTTTADCEGSITSQQPIEHIKIPTIKTTLKSFVGKQQQIPPMFSALKKNGIPLYKLARVGKTVDREARAIEIFNITFNQYHNGVLTCEVSCSKGTYIRTLMEDIGNKLGCGAFVQTLRRTGFAHYDITDTQTFEQLNHLKINEHLHTSLRSSDSILPAMEDVHLDTAQTEYIRHGQTLTLNQYADKNEQVKLFHNNEFIGIGELDSGVLKSKRLFTW